MKFDASSSRTLAFSLLLGGLTVFSQAEEPIDPRAVSSTLLQASAYFRTHIAVHGGYVYYYSLDLEERWGEGLAQPEEIWVQPPGTPTVGLAYLKACQATGDTFYLDAARETAEALVFGRLRSGGWQNSINLDGIDSGQRFSGGDQRKPGFSSLDDGQSQSAIQFLALTDEALKFEDNPIHQASLSALDALLAAQFPNGGFPQGWNQPVSEQPIIAAQFPDYDWKTEGRIKNYWDMYTLNDNVCGYVAEALSVAYDIYDDPKYLAALKKLGDFLILAQLPEPQPAWAQQYNYEMVPIWARKFEPPAIAGDESQEVIETLLKVHAKTGDAKYLEPIPRALDYLERSLLPDGRLARYYELQNNRPLYMTRVNRETYELSHDNSNLPSHYGWKSASRIGELQSDYERLKNGGPINSGAPSSAEAEVRRIVDALDDQGRWISVHDGERLVGQPKFELNAPYISSAVFSRNVEILAEFLKASRRNED